MNEAEMTEDKVREEHLREVHQEMQWAYLFGVLVVGFLLMVGLIALLGSGGG